MNQSIGRSVLLVSQGALAAMWFASAPIASAAARSEADPNSSSGYAEIEGARLYYEMAGSGAPVVFIHGNAGDRRHWDQQFSALAGEFRVIRYDARGYGRSSVPAEDAPYSDHEDLSALLDQLGVPRAHLVGWSMGAATAIDFAIRRPDRTLSVTAVGPWVAGYSSPAADDVFAGFANVAAAAQQRGREAALRAFMDAPFFAATSGDAAARAQFKRIGADYSFWAFAHRDPRRTLEPPASTRLTDVRAPLLILAGEHDILACLEISELLDETVRDSTRIVVPGAGHLLHLERAELFNAHLAKFIRAASGRDASMLDGFIPAGPFDLGYRIEGQGRTAIVIRAPAYYSRFFSPSLREGFRLVFKALPAERRRSLPDSDLAKQNQGVLQMRAAAAVAFARDQIDRCVYRNSTHVGA